MLLCTLCCFVHLDSQTAVVFCQGKPNFGIRCECMNAENLCTTYYLVLLFSMWTPALKCGVYLFSCLCLTLCAPHRSLLCCFQFGLFWWNGYERAAHRKSLTHIGCSYFPPCTIGRPLGPRPSCPPKHFFIFWYNLWLRILPQLFTVSQSFLNWF